MSDQLHAAAVLSCVHNVTVPVSVPEYKAMAGGAHRICVSDQRLSGLEPGHSAHG
jgi:hypothetical protein